MHEPGCHALRAYERCACAARSGPSSSCARRPAPAPTRARPAPQVFEGGALFDPKVLDIKDEDLMKSVSAAIANVAAASLELGHPTLASIPHMVVHGYKNVLAVAVATEYDFPLAEKARLGCPNLQP